MTAGLTRSGIQWHGALQLYPYGNIGRQRVNISITIITSFKETSQLILWIGFKCNNNSFQIQPGTILFYPVSLYMSMLFTACDIAVFLSLHTNCCPFLNVSKDICRVYILYCIICFVLCYLVTAACRRFLIQLLSTVSTSSFRYCTFKLNFTL